MPRTDELFLLTPLREGRRIPNSEPRVRTRFLLTPLREGRLCAVRQEGGLSYISTHAPAGGATYESLTEATDDSFLLTPLREGRQALRQ